MGETVLLQWGDGDINAVALAKVARAAKRDGINIAMIDKLSQVGTETMGNCARDLTDLLKETGALSHVSRTGGEIFTHCILPSEILKLVGRSREKFKRHIAPNRNVLRQCWREFLSSAAGLEYQSLHPHLRGKTVEELSLCVACRLHEDSGPFSKTRKSVDLIDWGSLHGGGSERDCRY